MENLKIGRDKLAWVAVGFFLGAIAISVAFGLTRQSRPAPIYISTAPPINSPDPTDTPGPYRVYINGQVAVPGVVELPQGSIVQDAIEAAGGYNHQADVDVINLAMPLSDGMHIYVPDVNENVQVPVVSLGSANRDEGAGKVNINIASLEELDDLPGIGPATAQKIIDYRLANGSFPTIESLLNVSGIGPVKFEEIRALISID